MFGDLESIVSEIRETLPSSASIYLCSGAPLEAVAWSNNSQITVRISLKIDELWLIAGAGSLIRFVAASDGDFGDVTAVLNEILNGTAIEVFSAEFPGNPHAIPQGFFLESSGFSGGLSPAAGQWTSRISGPFPKEDLA